MVEIGDKLVGFPEESGKTIGSEPTTPEIGSKVVILNSLGKQTCYPITSPTVGDKVSITPDIGGKRIVLNPGAGTASITIVLTITDDTHVWRSIDGGLTWADRGALSAFGECTGLAIEYMGSGVVLAAIADNHTGNPVPQIYRSADYGSTWTLVFSLPKPPAALWGYITSLTRITNTECLACTSFSTTYMYKSYDAGLTWSVFDTVSYITQTDQVMGRTLLGRKSNQILRSLDGGTSWSVVQTLPYNSGILLYCGDGYAMVGGSALVSGALLYRSANSGATWTDVSSVSCPEGERFCYCGNGVVLLSRWAGSSARLVYRSTDGGINWTYIQSLGTYEICLASVGDGVAISTSNNGLCYRSIDSGASWTYIRAFGMPARATYAFSAPLGTV